MLTISPQCPEDAPRVKFSTTIDVSPSIEPTTRNKIAERWKKKIQQHQAKKFIIGIDDNKLRKGIMTGTITSIIVDSGATSGVGTATNPSQCTGRQSTKQFILPSGAVVPATSISPQASVSITSKYADANYITIFDRDTVNIYDANDTEITVTKGAILRGWRDPDINLWQIPLVNMVRNNNTNRVIVNRPPTEFLPARPPPSNAVHNVYELKTQPELVRYHHASAGFPTKRTWLAAIKNKQYAAWPGLTLDAACKHLPDLEETHKGHGRKTLSGLRSTKPTTHSPLDDRDEAFGFGEEATVPSRPCAKEKTIFYRVLDLANKATMKIYTNQPGRFPKKLLRGNQYIMVLTESDSDVILVEPMKNRTSGEMIRAYQALIDRLHAANIVPKHHILDIKCSDEFKITIKSNDMTYQLVLPHDHHRNQAEKAIQIFKDHFIAILCGADKEFPLTLWDLPLPQAKATLNMLRPSRVTPTVSAYPYAWGQHDYNANPFAPLGCKVEAHLVPSICETWAPHTASGYYVGNSPEHYRCHKVFINNTRHTRVCSTVFFKCKYLTMPTITPADALIRAADSLTNAIAGIVPPPNMTMDANNQLLNIFKSQTEKAKDAATAQRVLKERAQAQRVPTEANHQEEVPTTEPISNPTTQQLVEDTPFPLLEVEYPNIDVGILHNTPFISQDDHLDTSTPAQNTRHQREVRTITQDYLFHMMDTPDLAQPFTNKPVAARK
jgi:hypothetical protein